MAREPIDYSRQLSNIAAPTDAGEAQLRLKANAFNPEAGLIEYGGNLAIEAVKGKMAADLDKDVNEVLKNTLGIGVSEESIRQKWEAVDKDLAQKLIDHSTSDDYAGVNGVRHLQTEAEKVKAAQVQGLLTPAEATIRIGKLVKEQSALMPGWASEFRKVGANLTGISNIDVYGVHSLLTAKAASDRRAEKMFAAQLDLDKEIAREFGVPLAGITEEHRIKYQASKQGKFALEQIENDVKRNNFTQAETDKRLGSGVMAMGASVIADLSLDMMKLREQYKDPTNIEQAKMKGLEFSGLIRQRFDNLEIEVMKLTKRKEDGGAGMSEDAARRHIADLRASFKHWEEGVKNIDGMSMFDSLVKISHGRLEMMMNNFSIANPHVAWLNKQGVMAELFRAYTNAEGNIENLEKMFGKDLVDAMRRVVTNPAGSQQFANHTANVNAGNPPNMPELRKSDPDMAKILPRSTLENISKWSALPVRNEQQQVALMNNIKAVPTQANVHSSEDVDKVYRMYTNPNTVKAVTDMSYEDRNTALVPTAQWIDGAMPRYKAQIKASLDKMKLNADTKHSVQWNIETNPSTGRIELVPNYMGKEPTSVIEANYRKANSVLPEGRDELASLRKRVDDLNKLTEVYHKTVSLVNPENDMTLADIRMSAVGMLTAGATSVLAPSFADYVNQIRRQQPTQEQPAGPGAPKSVSPRGKVDSPDEAAPEGSVSNVKTSKSGLDFLKKEEGFSETKYGDAAGFSVGYGHFIKPGEQLDKITKEQAEELLVKDVQEAEEAIVSSVKVELSQKQHDALVSFVYNVGTGAFKNSTLLKKLNAGDVDGAAAEFDKWNKSQGKTLDALVKRRKKEKEMFLARS